MIGRGNTVKSSSKALRKKKFDYSNRVKQRRQMQTDVDLKRASPQLSVRKGVDKEIKTKTADEKR